jgi:hypothetical protein
MAKLFCCTALVRLWHLATTADQTLCPLLVKADAASVGQSIKPCLVRQRHTQCQPGQEGNGDDGVSSAPASPTMSQSLGSCPAGGSDQLTGGLRWAILPLQSGLRWNRWFRPGGTPRRAQRASKQVSVGATSALASCGQAVAYALASFVPETDSCGAANDVHGLQSPEA